MLVERELKLISIDALIETEEYDHDHAINLAMNIKKHGMWTVPIAIESSMLTVMDGHHRLNAARFLGLARVPCLLMTYRSGGVVVKSWRDDIFCSVEGIRAMVENSQKYPIKTTRHLFNPPIRDIMIDLNLLY